MQTLESLNGEETQQNTLSSVSLLVLLTVQTDIDYLKDVVVSAEFQCSNIDLDIVLQEVLCKLANLFRPGSTPHQGLSVRLGKSRTRSRPKLNYDIINPTANTHLP